MEHLTGAAAGRQHGTGRRTTRHGRYTATSAVVAGPGVLEQLGAELDDLVEAAAMPVTARGTWLRAWARSHRPSEPWAVTVRDASSDRLDGVALLSSRRTGDHEAISPLGRRQADRGALPVRHRGAAAALADALVSCLAGRRQPWTVRLGQLPAGDPVAAGVVRRLGGARSVPGLPIPAVEFGDATTLDGWLGKGLRKQLRKARNRLAADGVDEVTSFTRDAGRIASLLGEIELTHREREREADRRSVLETTPGLDFWRAAVLDHARRAEIEVATLHLDTELAAYVVSFVDGESYRVFDGRLATAWARYSPGRLLEAAMLERTLGDAGFRRVDWMNGCASEKLVAANAADPTEHLVAASPGLVVDLDVIGRRPGAASPEREPALVSLARAAR